MTYKLYFANDAGNDSMKTTLFSNNVSDDLKERVAFIHNNLEVEHFIKNKKGYLVSWEKSKIDSPILDLITFYQKEYMN